MSYFSSAECLGRIFWRELCREFAGKMDLVCTRDPIPAFQIRWRPARSFYHAAMLTLPAGAESSTVDPSVYVEGAAPILVGNGVRIEEDVILATSSHQLRNGQFLRGPIEARPIVIEDGVTVGRGSIICGGVLLGRGAKIEPGSVVSSSIQPAAIASGVPAKPNLAHRLKTAGLLPASVNLLGTRTYLNAATHLIREFFGDQIEIGKDTFFNRDVTIRGGGKLHIGERTFIAPRAEIDLTQAAEDSFIEDDVWIGAGAKLIAPFRVRKQSIVAAGCHYTGTNKRSGVWGGRPAKLIHHDTATAHLILH